jgi:hypothetical protein
MSIRFLAAPLAAAIGLALVGAPAAEAASKSPPIACGSHVTTSITLTKDLICVGPALYLDGGDTQIVNLNGHTVASAPPGSETLRVEGATIEHGRIQGNVASFEGIGAAAYKDVIFDGSTISNGGTVKNSTLLHSIIFGSQASIDVENSTLIDSEVSGWETWEMAIGNNFINSTLEVDAFGSSADFERNSMTGGGIIIDGDGGRVPGIIASNTIVGAPGDGIILGEGAGVGNSPAHYVGLIVSNNQVSFSAGDGIDVQPAGGPMNVTLTANKLVSNARYGIESPGSTPPSIIIMDGGTNVAKKNVVGQCLNITCSAK